MKKIIYKLQNKISNSFWFLHPDIHERQRFIASKLSKNDKVLDVGGEQRVLEKLVNLKEYYTLNVDPKLVGNHTHHKKNKRDLVYDGKKIPFEDNSFETVVCIDVLEHVSSLERADLIAEMLRVAKNKLIISAPYGSKKHMIAEKILTEELNDYGETVEFLEEHVKMGLPRKKDIVDWQKKYEGEVVYSGNFSRSNFLLKFHLFKAKRNLINHILFFIRSFLYFFINIFFYPFIFSNSPKEKTNRFYLIINKHK